MKIEFADEDVAATFVDDGVWTCNKVPSRGQNNIFASRIALCGLIGNGD